MAKTTVSTEAAPKAVGPYAQGVLFGDLVFTSGQVALDPATGTIVEGGIDEQTRRVLRNVSAILDAAGSSLDDVVKTTVYLVDMAEFPAMNAVYAGFFPGERPARTTVAVSRLPLDARIEIDAVGIVRR